MSQKLIGRGNNQVPTNGMLGDLAFLDQGDFVPAQFGLSADTPTVDNLPNNSASIFKTGTDGSPELWVNNGGTVKRINSTDQYGIGINKIPVSQIAPNLDSLFVSGVYRCDVGITGGIPTLNQNGVCFVYGASDVVGQYCSQMYTTWTGEVLFRTRNNATWGNWRAIARKATVSTTAPPANAGIDGDVWYQV